MANFKLFRIFIFSRESRHCGCVNSAGLVGWVLDKVQTFISGFHSLSEIGQVAQIHLIRLGGYLSVIPKLQNFSKKYTQQATSLPKKGLQIHPTGTMDTWVRHTYIYIYYIHIYIYIIYIHIYIYTCLDVYLDKQNANLCHSCHHLFFMGSVTVVPQMPHHSSRGACVEWWKGGLDHLSTRSQCTRDILGSKALTTQTAAANVSTCGKKGWRNRTQKKGRPNKIFVVGSKMGLENKW